MVIQKDETPATTDTPPVEGERPKRDKVISSYEDVQTFMAEMVKKHKLDEETVQATFDKTKFDYSIIDLMDRPAEKRSRSY